MNRKHAVKYFRSDTLELSGRADGEKQRLVGHAAVFNRVIDLGWFTEEILPGAFSSAIERNDDVRALFNHDPNLVLGRTTNETLALEEDSIGLLATIYPPTTRAGEDVLELVQRGDISQMSFAFSVLSEDIDRTNPNKPHFRIKDVKLYDVSPVTYPAYESTDISAESARQELRDRLSALVEPPDIDAMIKRAQAEYEARQRQIKILSLGI